MSGTPPRRPHSCFSPSFKFQPLYTQVPSSDHHDHKHSHHLPQEDGLP
jgi:hypothetical protein